MCQAALDYRFGWRWLLPAVTGNIRMYGFSDEEVQFWYQIFPDARQETENSHSAVLLINADRCTTQAQPTLADMQTAELVCVIGQRESSRQWRVMLSKSFSRVQEYGLLPANNPRVVVPFSASRHAIAALRLHQPGRWIARLGLWLARVLAMFGNFWLLRSRVLLIASRSSSFIPRGALQAELPDRFGEQSLDYALYLGTPDGNRKTIVLPLGDTPPDTILKVAETPRARASLLNEAAALSVLAQTPLSICVPQLKRQIPTGTSLVLWLEYRPRLQTSQRHLDNAAAYFLGQMMASGSRMEPLAHFLRDLSVTAGNNQLPADVADACRALHGRLQVQAKSGERILLHRTHGDFAPWNCAWTSQGLFVFDWEESRENALALGDAFYYSVAPALLVQRNASAIKTLQTVFGFADQVVQMGEVKLDIRIYLALWLLPRAGYAKLYGELCVLLAQRWR